MCDCSQDCIDFAKISKYPTCVIRRRESKRKTREKNKRKVVDYLGGQCVDCGMVAAVVDSVMRVGKAIFAPMCAFDVEHTDWKNKKFGVSNMTTASWGKIKKELDDSKCVLVCKICHSIRTKKLSYDPEFQKKRSAKNRKTWKNQYTESPKALNSTSA